MNVRFDVANWGGSGPAWERVRGTLLHQKVDRLPITAWRHFPGFEQSADSIARAHLAFQMRYGFDLLVVRPQFGYAAIPWGFAPSSDRNDYGFPITSERPLEDTKKWPQLNPIRCESTYEHIAQSVRIIKRNLPEDVPIILTVYGPLTTAHFLRGERLVGDLEPKEDNGYDPNFLGALAVITQGIEQLIEQCRKWIDGVYYISHFTSSDLFSDHEFAVSAMAKDLSLLRSMSAMEKLLILHLHGNELLYDEVLDYPVDVLSWHDRWVKPSLRDARMKTNTVLMGGLNEADTMHRETPAAVALQIGDAISQVEGRGLILSPGGPINLDTPSENLRALVTTLRELSESSG